MMNGWKKKSENSVLQKNADCLHSLKKMKVNRVVKKQNEQLFDKS